MLTRQTQKPFKRIAVANIKGSIPRKTYVKETVKSPVDLLFNKYAESHQNPTNRLIHYLCIPLMMFGFLGLVWAIPFPYLKFLGQYNGFFNWASFLIAFIVYYYYKLAPVLSYLMLLFLFGFSYGTMKLDAWQKSGGPLLWLLSLVIIVASVGLQLLGNRNESRKVSFFDEIKLLPAGPVWLLQLLLKKFPAAKKN